MTSDSPLPEPEGCQGSPRKLEAKPKQSNYYVWSVKQVLEGVEMIGVQARYHHKR